MNGLQDVWIATCAGMNVWVQKRLSNRVVWALAGSQPVNCREFVVVRSFQCFMCYVLS